MIQLHHEQSIKDTIAQHEKVAIRFSATWCGPCKQFTPAWAEVAATETNITFLDVDADTNQALANEFHVRGLPSVVFFDKGVKIGLVAGVMTADKFREVIRKQYDR